MILELAWTYLPAVVVTLFWAVAMRPLLRLIHAPATPPRRRSRRER